MRRGMVLSVQGVAKLLLACFVLLFLSCASSQETGLGAKLERLPAGESFRLALMTDCKWDSVRIVGPYERSGQFDAIDMPRNMRSAVAAMESADDRCVLLFFDGGDVSAYAEIPRSAMDFAEFGGEWLLPEWELMKNN